MAAKRQLLASTGYEAVRGVKQRRAVFSAQIKRILRQIVFTYQPGAGRVITLMLER